MLGVAAGGSVAGWYFFAGRSVLRPDLLTHPIRKEKLQVTIVERGNLEAARNNEIICRVKARAQGSTTASTIRWVIDDGSPVVKGERIMELDDSGLQDTLATQQILVAKAKGDWDKSEEDYKITLATNFSTLATAELLIEITKLTEEEYKEGTYQQLELELQGKVTMAESDLMMWDERAAWSERMSRPGRGFVTVSQAEADRARRLSAEITRNNLQKQLKVLRELTFKKTAKDNEGKVAEAIRALDKAKKEATAKLVQADVAREVFKATYEKELARQRDIENEIKNCTITAPIDGIAVYVADERGRSGFGNASLIAQGETVREGQKMMKIPDLSKMVVETKIHEAMVSRVRGNRVRRTGFTPFVQSSRLLTPNPLGGLMAYASFDDMRTEFVGNHRDADTEVLAHGQHATIRVNAFADRLLNGHVKSVATVPSKQDWLSADVRVYQAIVAIDDTADGLKPGMDSEVTIFVDTHSEPVLSVPLQAVLGSVDMGQKRKCYVIDADEKPQMREITLGLSNEKMAEVMNGLEEGDRVVLNPLVLLSEKEKHEHSNQPVRMNHGGDKGGPQGKGKDKGGLGKGGPPSEGAAPGAGGQFPGAGAGKGNWQKGGGGKGNRSKAGGGKGNWTKGGSADWQK